MHDTEGKFAEPFCGSALNSYDSPKNPSARSQLERRKKDLLSQLSDIDSALQALNENPEIERVLTLVGRTVRL